MARLPGAEVSGNYSNQCKFPFGILEVDHWKGYENSGYDHPE